MTKPTPRCSIPALLREVPFIDGHNDLAWQVLKRTGNRLAGLGLGGNPEGREPALHTDLPRLREGCLGGVFWSAYTAVNTAGPGAARAVFEQVDVVHRLVERHPQRLELALTADDVVRIHREGRVASLIGLEGGHCLENSLAVLRQLYRVGARSLALAHSRNTDWADSCTDEPAHDGLSLFGEQVVREMNRLGMLVDLSHAHDRTMHRVLRIAEAPPWFSHSGARAVCDHPRNVPDDVLRWLAEKDGVVMVTLVPGFVSEEVLAHERARHAEEQRHAAAGTGECERVTALREWDAAHPAPRATLAQVADHVDHVRRVAGIDHVGVGTDFDGVGVVPEGLEDVSALPGLLEELRRRGYTDGELAKVAGGNALRVLRGAEGVARRLARERPASEVLFAAVRTED